MPQLNQSVKIHTQGKRFHNITAEVNRVIRNVGINDGLCIIFIRHTSASLVIQENADPDVLFDLENFFSKLVPEDTSLYRHIMEGSDDMPAHIRSVLTKTTETIPIVNGYLGLGTWQALYIWEHRDRGSQRELILHLSGQ